MILLLAALARASVPAGLGSWTVLRDDDVWVGCVEREGYPWCRSRSVVGADLPAIERILLDVDRYPQVFKRVTEVHELEPLLLYVVLDMPFPLANRDFVAQYTRRADGSDVVFAWEPVRHPSAPPGDAVRLERSTGEWRLTPVSGGTQVTYTWNAELGGDVPAWALPSARRLWGEEIMGWLRDEVRAGG